MHGFLRDELLHSVHQVYKAILDQGLILGLPWGTDPDEGDSPSTTGEGQSDVNETSTNLE